MFWLHSLVLVTVLAGYAASVNAFAGISVSSGNSEGISPPAFASESPRPFPPPDPTALSSRDGYTKLTTPEITEIRRLDLSRVKIRWTCAQPGFGPTGMATVRLVIMRQSSNGKWQRVHEQPWAAQGEYIDNATTATIWRWSAITTFTEGLNLLSAGSDAAALRELDYGPATYGILGYRGGLPFYSWAPPGHDLSGPKEDWFQTVAHSFDGQNPSFISTNPPIPPGEDAPLTFIKDGPRYYPDPEPPDNYTELSTSGYVIRGKPFNIQAQARVNVNWEPREVCTLGFDPLTYLVQPERVGMLGGGALQSSRWELRPTEIEFLGTRFEAAEELGFDSATYFASQHLRGASPDGTRHIKMFKKGVGVNPTLTTTGPIALSNQTSVEDGIEFDLQPTANVLDDAGKVEESTTHRELKAITLQAQSWTIGVYPVDIFDAQTNVLHTGPTPPPADSLQAALNNIFGKQANVTFQVVVGPRLTINTADLNPPFPNYPPSVSAIKPALWNASNKENLTLFWVDQMEPGTLAQAFGIPSRGALIGPYAGDFAIGHELGHCFGLHHCWHPDSVSALTQIADQESKRLMGYAGGKFVRSDEIVIINRWQPTVTPLGP